MSTAPLSALAATTTPVRPVTAAAPATQPALAVASAAPEGTGGVDMLDQQARSAQQALEGSARGRWWRARPGSRPRESRPSGSRSGCRSRSRVDSVALSATGATFISEPLILAMLELHVAARRHLGSRFTTVVPGLTSDQGCQGDFVGERLLYVYGTAAAGPAGATDQATVEALDRMARQVACLGAGQIASWSAR